MWKALRDTFLLTLAVWLSSVSAFDLRDIASSVVQGAGKEVSAATDPLAEGLILVANNLCPIVTKAFINKDKEPDMSELNLQYRSPNITMIFPLSHAAEMIPQHLTLIDELIVFVHGFTDSPSKSNFEKVYEAFAAIGKYNVLAMDSSPLISEGYDYVSSATKYVQYIGTALGKVLAAFKHLQLYCIGHSLGAHICGFTGKSYRNATGSSLQRITALDPAGPCYIKIPDDMKLEKTDANFTDVIHTDMRVYGIDEILGHVDFFPNGGSNQPDCVTQSCSHGRVVDLYVESVTNPNAFLATACESYEDFRKGHNVSDDVSIMGYSCPPSTRGTYCLQTDGSSPYGLGESGTHYDNNVGVVRNLEDGLGDLLNIPF